MSSTGPATTYREQAIEASSLAVQPIRFLTSGDKWTRKPVGMAGIVAGTYSTKSRMWASASLAVGITARPPRY